MPEAPDAQLVAGAGAASARCSLWWTGTPSLDGQRTGLIGHYEADDAGAAARLLDDATRRLAAQGCAVAVGPMDGSTWARYRFVTDAGPEPPFFLEPWNPPEWPRHWEAAGFAPLAHYVSSMVVKPAQAVRPTFPGDVHVRPLDLARFEDELRSLHALALRSFQPNFLYTPIGFEAFLALYAPLAPHLDPRLLWVAERAGRPVGVSFALPDLLEPKRGAPLRTAILKTLAVDPAEAGKGLGGALTAHTLAQAWAAGYARVIGALMHVENRSLRISDRHGPPMRRYTLFARRLDAA